ncbi:hypothetical protein NMG29_20425 [Streptomyces cocklensis]|uniref:Uncharacterized protein n=1 Tax=Actinacidiphila cocklensis TaxID=887465 RepID=A0A9W4GR48_9ACTN|nr:hypothetical protein [Actinacidiphila cocklensis]MDD1060543.1 hypothetical protein [Actinacidiphila cocklensis]WSX73927.1 hypothetical protein OH826_08670 [Streptomyces sp. NBC_00899]WSX80008.1 hypothetical protein OH826_42840 [Streptomyces sp. NBC_00899]CAG6393946.1 conserved hypothetical protein [Actinacidiphila cocklensis]
MSASPLVLPPVRLLPPGELAQLALAVPLLDRALRLARWAAPERVVDAMGELLDADLVAAAEALGLAGGEEDGEDGLGETAQAWGVAVDTGLVELEIEEEAEESTPPGEAAGRAVPGEAYERVTAGEPQDVLDVWLAAAEVALAEAAAPDIEQLRDVMDDGEMPLADEQEWDPEEEAEFLDTALANLYTLMALDDGTETDQGAVPLPVLAASLVVPDEMEQPSDEVLEDVTEAMMRLDDHFRLLAPSGLLEYRPVDEALIEEDEDQGPAGPGDELDPEEFSRYGLVRLTPLGVHGLRELLMDAGASAPLVGDLAGATGTELLDALAHYPDHAARAEAELWLVDRKPADAARELLAAARGDDEGAPARRLMCQQTLTLVGAEAEPALREVLDDRQLGGLARVWLTESGASDVPTPDADMIFWLTIDTLAAQLAADDDPELLSDLVRDLVARHDGFFDAAWRVEHPATADVLEAMGRLHPDRRAAKDARKAAFKARSRDGS